MRIWSAAVLWVFFSFSLSAQDKYQDVKVVEDRHFSLTKRFFLDLDFSALPLDAYFKPLVVEGAIGYQFHDLWGWEVIRAGYSLSNFDTGLAKDIERDVDAKPRLPSIENFRFKLASIPYVNLFYSKSNLLNLKVMYHQWQIGAGPSYYDMDGKNQFALDFVGRGRLLITEHVMLNLHVGYSLGFKSDASQHIMFLGVGAGVYL